MLPPNSLCKDVRKGGRRRKARRVLKGCFNERVTWRITYMAGGWLRRVRDSKTALEEIRISYK